MPNVLLTEAATAVEAKAVAGKPGRFLVQLINPGWGSSGYYSAEVLEAAAKAKVFKAGTHMYIDHPTESEEYERPERSLRDLAAVLVEDGYWDGGAVVAEAAVFGPYREVLSEMKDAIGASIRAAAKVTDGGTAEGRRGRIINELVEATSVDFVTKAGRGGRILEVLESARPLGPIDVSEATMRELEQQLSAAVRDAYGAEKSWTWVRDFDDSTVWFQVETPDDCATYAQAYTAGDAGVELTGDRSEVEQRITYVPVKATESNPKNVPAPRPDESITTESHKESPMGEKTIEESEFTRLVEAAGRVETLEAELKKAQADLAEATKKPEEKPLVAGPRAKVQEHIQHQDDRIAALEAREGARGVIGEVLADAWIGEAQKARLTSELMGDLPMVEGKLDESKLRESATARVNEAETEAAEILDAAGFGKPRGLGALTTPATEAATKQVSAALTESLGEAFGLSESAAEIAVKGR